MATRWADYCISAVRYNAAHTHIDAVRVHQDLGETLGQGSIWTRTQVVATIDRRSSICTTFKGTDGKWRCGAAVEVVVLDGQRFLRTDSNQRKADNLGNLPELPAESQVVRY